MDEIFVQGIAVSADETGLTSRCEKQIYAIKMLTMNVHIVYVASQSACGKTLSNVYIYT
jgi:hypothetical protein